MSTLILRLPEDLEANLTEHARREGQSRSEVAREAITQFLTRKGYERLMAAFVTEARAAYADPTIRKDALAIAEEALLTDDDVLPVGR